jgi:YgiT-type zinc finger domain-containing protein
MAEDNHKQFDRYRDLLAANTPEECEVCGGPLVLEKVNLEDYQEGKLYMMEGVPAFVCQECGEIWVPEPIMQEFEKMIETAQSKGTHPKESPKEKGKKGA